MATKKKLLQAAAGSAGGGEPGLNVEQLFSTYLYEGIILEMSLIMKLTLGSLMVVVLFGLLTVMV